MATQTNETNNNKAKNVLSLAIEIDVGGERPIVVGFVNLNDYISPNRIEEIKANPNSLWKWLGEKKAITRVFESNDIRKGIVD